MIERNGGLPKKVASSGNPAGRCQRRDVTGIVVLDKPSGMTSNRALQRVRRLYRARKAGHTGSLDPLASGVLPICLGEATKLSGLLLDASKCYEVIARLGARTDTGDADGDVIETCEWSHVDRNGVESVLRRFVGDIEQIPPMYSALKHEGRRLYALAREGRTIERAPRAVTIHSLEATGLDGRDLALRVCCSKGTYVRTLVEDLGKALDTVAHVVHLRRLSAGGLDQSKLVSMETIEAAAAVGDEALDALLQAPDSAVPDLEEVVLDEREACRITQGQQIDSPVQKPGTVRLYGPCRRFLGLGQVSGDGRLAARRLFRTDTGPKPGREGSDLRTPRT